MFSFFWFQQIFPLCFITFRVIYIYIYIYIFQLTIETALSQVVTGTAYTVPSGNVRQCVFLNIHLGGIECVFMCMCVYVRMFWNASVWELERVCVYLCMCFCVHHACIHLSVCMWIYVLVGACFVTYLCEDIVCVYPCIRFSVYVHMDMHLCVCVCVFWNAPVWEHKICVCVCVHVHLCVSVCMCIYMFWNEPVWGQRYAWIVGRGLGSNPAVE